MMGIKVIIQIKFTWIYIDICQISALITKNIFKKNQNIYQKESHFKIVSDRYIFIYSHIRYKKNN